MFMRLETKANNRSHGDGFFVAASPPLQSRACCGRYARTDLTHNLAHK